MPSIAAKTAVAAPRIKREVTTFTLSALHELHLLGRLVLPEVTPDAAEDARLTEAILTNASLGLLTFAVRVEPNAQGIPGATRHPDAASGRLLARILAEDGAVMQAIQARSDAERIELWRYVFPAELYPA